MIPEALATGRCEVRPSSYVRKIELDRRGRAMGVKYFDAEKREIFQRARAVFVCANGAETPRLLLMSKSNLFPDGLANSSGAVGKHIMFNCYTFAGGLFEHEINGYRGMVDTRVIQDTYELDPKLGLWGGGGFDFRFDFPPIDFALSGLGPDAPAWGPAYKRMLRDYYTRTGIDVPTRELLTFSMLVALGGCEPQVKGHVAANLHVGNDRARLIEVVTQLLPFIGYPRTLNALRVVDEVTGMAGAAMAKSEGTS